MSLATLGAGTGMAGTADMAPNILALAGRVQMVLWK